MRILGVQTLAHVLDLYFLHLAQQSRNPLGQPLNLPESPEVGESISSSATVSHESVLQTLKEDFLASSGFGV